MLERLLHYAAIVCSLCVVLSWGLFAIDETREASNLSATEVAGKEAATTVDPTPEQEDAREAAHGPVREAIDDVNDVLTLPFAALVEDSDSQWLRRTVPALLALVVFGFGLGYLARFARGRG